MTRREEIRLSALIGRHFAGAHAALRGDLYGEYWLSGGRGSG